MSQIVLHGPPLWLWLMLVAATAQAVKDLFLKQTMTGPNALESIVVVWAYCLTTTLFLGAGLTLEDLPRPTPTFWIVLAVTGPMASFTLYAYVRALELGDLSLTAPMLTFTPLFLLVTSPIMVGETPQPWGVAGIVSVVGGAYIMNLGRWRSGPLEPFRALLRDRGVRLMLLVAFLWSISGNFDKIGLRNSSPNFWIAMAFGATTLCLTPIVWRVSRRGFSQVWTKPWSLTAAGALEALTAWCQMMALTMTIVPYVIAAKRLSAVVAVLLGGLVLGEPDLRQRLAGSALMVAGVLLIAFLG
ncbi:hypothetical protein JCM15519_10480 [Fundidesulfovibrio butyratiphilus]